MKITALMLTLVGVSACGISAQSRMEMSEGAYNQCLLFYPTEPASCDQLKRAYEQDKAAYEKN